MTKCKQCGSKLCNANTTGKCYCHSFTSKVLRAFGCTTKKRKKQDSVEDILMRVKKESVTN
jgi:threonine synthase